MELAGFHDLRRLNATTLVVGGVDVKAAQVRLGHSDPRMTRKKPNGTAQKGSFIRSNPEDRANIAPKIDGYRVKSPAATLSPGTFVVGLPGFEPGTSASRTQRANQAAPQPVRSQKEAGPPL